MSSTLAADDLLRRRAAPGSLRTQWPSEAPALGEEALAQAAGLGTQLDGDRVAVACLPPGLDDDDLVTAAWNLVTSLLKPVAQYDTGELLYPVEVRPGEDGASHYSASADAGGLHTDGSLLPRPPDVGVLLCLSPAQEGGETILVPAESVRRHLADHHPDLLPVLYRTHPFATQDDTATPRQWAPVLRDAGGKVRARYLRKYIEAGWRLADKAAPQRLFEALEAIDAFVLSGAERLAYPLRRGEVLLWRNAEFLHGRNAFVEGTRRRRLVRFYGQDDVERPAHRHSRSAARGQ